MRVWIETYSITKDKFNDKVTLRVRVWIETGVNVPLENNLRCHPPREGVD